MTNRWISRTALAFAVLLAPGVVLSQEHPPAGKPAAPPAEKKPADKPATGDKPPAGAPQPSEEEMKAMMEAMNPGPPHQKLAKLAGDWTFKSKMIMEGAPAEESDGTAKITVIMDGRFIEEAMTGSMMGMPFTGKKILGYNNGSKKYEGLWMYTLGTGMLLLNGTSDDGGKTLKCSATFDNEIGIRETLNLTYTFADNDNFTVVLDGGKMPDGTPGPTLQAKYTRKK